MGEKRDWLQGGEEDCEPASAPIAVDIPFRELFVPQVEDKWVVFPLSRRLPGKSSGQRETGRLRSRHGAKEDPIDRPSGQDHVRMVAHALSILKACQESLKDLRGFRTAPFGTNTYRVPPEPIPN